MRIILIEGKLKHSVYVFDFQNKNGEVGGRYSLFVLDLYTSSNENISYTYCDINEICVVNFFFVQK